MIPANTFHTSACTQKRAQTHAFTCINLTKSWWMHNISKHPLKDYIHIHNAFLGPLELVKGGGGGFRKL